MSKVGVYVYDLHGSIMDTIKLRLSIQRGLLQLVCSATDGKFEGLAMWDEQVRTPTLLFV